MNKKKRGTMLPNYARRLFAKCRYKVLYGGRGSSKSYTVAKVLLIKAKNQYVRCLCAREYQNSINESVHKLLSEQIEEMGFLDDFVITDHRIYNKKNGSEFLFKGVRQNVQSIKSMQGITDLWLEEAQTISQYSWDILVPTIREVDSEIWVTFNPEDDDDPTYTKFVNPDHTPRQMKDLICIEVNWRDNPWFPEVLEKEKDYQFEVNPDLALHVWEGQCRRNSEAQIMSGKWIVKDFEVSPEWAGPYLGADWGFSVDPTVMVEVYINTDTRELMIRREAHGYHVELDDIPELFDNIPVSRQVESRGDNSRPETISHLQRRGFPIVSCAKWSGSVEDGIEFIKNFRKVIIHTSCVHMQAEAKNYSYKVDRLTGQVSTIVVDEHNHCWDAVRYALEPLISSSAYGILGVL